MVSLALGCFLGMEVLVLLWKITCSLLPFEIVVCLVRRAENLSELFFLNGEWMECAGGSLGNCRDVFFSGRAVNVQGEGQKLLSFIFNYDTLKEISAALSHW